MLKRSLGLESYESVWQAMRMFTDQRTVHTPDELWIVEHPPVYTQGLAGDPAHYLLEVVSQSAALSKIPFLKTDRGGQITYHGPGQLIFYPLIDLKRYSLGLSDVLNALQDAVIQLLRAYQLVGERRLKAPGVYVEDKKIAFVGLKVRRGCTYHGLSLNVEMDLSPFEAINPCGYPGLLVTQLRDLGCKLSKTQIAEDYSRFLLAQLELRCRP